MYRHLRSLFLLPTLLGVLLSVHNLQAAQVDKVKGKRLLISLEGEEAQKGDVYYLINSNGQKKAIIKIMAIRGGKAIAVLGKGRAFPGMTLEYREKKSSKRKSRPKQMADNDEGQEDGEDESSSKYADEDTGMPTHGMYYGVLLGYAMDKMDVDLGSGLGTKSLEGNGFSVKGLFDWEMFPSIWFRGLFGIENFNVESQGQSNKLCGDSGNEACTLEIMYISADFWARYVIGQGSFRPWLGAVFGFLLPASKSSTAIKDSSITTNSFFGGGLGFDYFMSEKMFIPFQVELGMLPDSNETKSSFIAIRAGVGFSF